MLYAPLAEHKVKPLHQENVACITNVYFIADCVVKYILKLALILPVHTLAAFFLLAYSRPTLLQPVWATLLFIHYCIHCNPAQ